MAKKSSVNKNEKRAKMAKRFAGKRARLKGIALDRNAPEDERFAAQLKLSEMPRNSSPVRYRNRCELTGRPRAVYKKFGLCRVCLRTMAHEGLIPGMTKSSW